MTTVYIEPDSPEKGTCGNCQRCIDACPNKAIIQPKVIDAHKCISYWTIEHRGDFPNEKLNLAGNLFGCDICQDVCPYNKKINQRKFKKSNNYLLKKRIPERLSPEEIINIKSKEEFLEKFAGTPLMRAGYAGMKRNARALKNKQIQS